MPISFRILDEHALVVCTYLGEITDAILLEAWDDFYRHNSIKRGYNEISDLRQAKVTAVTSRGLRDLVALVEDLSFRQVTGRVAKILLEHAGDGTGPRSRLTQQEMAAMAGTAREVVGRSLKSLEDEGAIRLDRHRIVITDREALREMAGGTA